jgi:hypothetical protein
MASSLITPVPIADITKSLNKAASALLELCTTSSAAHHGVASIAEQSTASRGSPFQFCADIADAIVAPLLRVCLASIAAQRWLHSHAHLNETRISAAVTICFVQLHDLYVRVSATVSALPGPELTKHSALALWQLVYSQSLLQCSGHLFDSLTAVVASRARTKQISADGIALACAVLWLADMQETQIAAHLMTYINITGDTADDAVDILRGVVQYARDEVLTSVRGAAVRCFVVTAARILPADAVAYVSDSLRPHTEHHRDASAAASASEGTSAPLAIPLVLEPSDVAASPSAMELSFESEAVRVSLLRHATHDVVVSLRVLGLLHEPSACANISIGSDVVSFISASEWSTNTLFKCLSVLVEDVLIVSGTPTAAPAVPQLQLSDSLVAPLRGDARATGMSRRAHGRGKSSVLLSPEHATRLDVQADVQRRCTALSEAALHAVLLEDLPTPVLAVDASGRVYQYDAALLLSRTDLHRYLQQRHELRDDEWPLLSPTQSQGRSTIHSSLLALAPPA